MSDELILSEEIFDAEYEIDYRYKKLYRFENYLTDGEMVIDTRKNYYSSNYGFCVELQEEKFNAIINPFIQDEYLKKVLQAENQVQLSDVSYKGVALLKNKVKNHLISAYYAEELKGLELFYFENKIYFFLFNEAEPAAEIYFDSYMFIGFVMGIEEQSNFSKERLEILEKLEEFLNK